MDNYVVEQDKQKVTDFYDRAYITEKLKGLETELRQECRIVLARDSGSNVHSTRE